MCGIVGYIGAKDALSVIIAGLEKLEYRGYDSAGVAIIENGRLNLTRALGKLSELKKLFVDRPPTARAVVGIGHTRWATHGRPSEDNAHPHCAGRVSLIHNGIIENYAELKAKLIGSGVKFSSDTDTEVAAHLCNQFLQSGMEPFAALKATCAAIRGSYAFLVLDSEHPDRILIAKNATPIIIGIGEGEMVIASDIPAVLAISRSIVILEDGDMAEVFADRLYIEHDGETLERTPQTVVWDPVTAQKGGFKHFMRKEIDEQGRVVSDTLRGRIDQSSGSVVLPEFDSVWAAEKKVNRIVLTACGTAWHACLIGKFYFESFAGLPTEVDYASEFRYRGVGELDAPQVLVDQASLCIAVSQSGETADTLAAIEVARRHAQTAAICNVLGSSLTRKVGTTLYTHAGPEISVASTKAFVTQLVALFLLAVQCGRKRLALSDARSRALLDAIVKLPGALEATLSVESTVEKCARSVCQARDFLFLGRGICYPIALEGALKLKEISYIHAEGYPAGEMKHGPIALIDQHMPVVVVLQRSSLLFDKAMSNLREVESRGGRIIAVTDAEPQQVAELEKLSESVIEVPFISQELSPLLLSVPLQLLAYHVAVLNGTDVDLPRNLAKSVTVE